jgi:hypothetical protein
VERICPDGSVSKLQGDDRQKAKSAEALVTESYGLFNANPTEITSLVGRKYLGFSFWQENIPFQIHKFYSGGSTVFVSFEGATSAFASTIKMCLVGKTQAHVCRAFLVTKHILVFCKHCFMFS